MGTHFNNWAKLGGGGSSKKELVGLPTVLLRVEYLMEKWMDGIGKNMESGYQIFSTIKRMRNRALGDRWGKRR